MNSAKNCVPFQKLWTEKQQRAMGWVHKMKVWVRAMRDHGRILFLTSFLRELKARDSLVSCDSKNWFNCHKKACKEVN